MKFLQLKHAIETALGIKEEPYFPNGKNGGQILPRTIPLYDPEKHKRKRELVAGGDVLWKPVNKMAAMVIAKAPWWAKVDYGTTQPDIDQLPAKPREKKQPHDSERVPIRTNSRTRKKGKVRRSQAPKADRQGQSENHPPIPSEQEALEMLYQGKITVEDMKLSH